MAGHVLYRFFNTAGELLYVGITNNPWSRYRDHQRDKTWFNEVASSTMQHFPSREELARAETHAIQTEAPKYNIIGAAPRQSPIPPSEVRLRAIHRRIGRSAFGSDASRFQAPDAIADEDSPPQMARQDHPCLKCARFFVIREVDDTGIPLNDIVRCLYCETEWTDGEWVAAVVERYGRQPRTMP